MDGVVPGPEAQALTEAARNLLLDCAGLVPGDRAVICVEDAADRWYDAATPFAVAEEAARLGIAVTFCAVRPPQEAQAAEVDALLAGPETVIFFARLGDQGRFAAAEAGRRVMVYARNAADFASPFGQVPYRVTHAVKQAVDRILLSAGQIEILCPNGTRLTGRAAGDSPASPPDVTTLRFPLGVPAPVPAAGFSGEIVLTDSLTPTGNRAYATPVLLLETPVVAQIENGRIAGFEGAARDVGAIRAHHERVGELFGIDPYVVHSWHAGLHPGCRFFPPVGRDRDYWSNTVFSSPRLLHFHTCGTAPPGEISWNIMDATVRVDGVPLWSAGRLHVAHFPELAGAAASDARLAALY
ncbi:hypothetical protein M4578_22240 [Salipiger sp. P9]|uniref:hypothetical protein n=1 Tax=Salipiger pentaromativorans TaxID=2943193 RepID=UPI002157015E|nr:hypothetical protein [Salipiger pentaromativorans]MCR8550552.1 hypothetical protein [Salipiger pentaromativorans]